MYDLVKLTIYERGCLTVYYLYKNARIENKYNADPVNKTRDINELFECIRMLKYENGIRRKCL